MKIRLFLDARNDYEFDIGHFRGAVRPDIQNFRELPGWIEDNREQLADKKSSLTVLVVFVVRNFPVG